jgi:CRISPR-associated protein Csm4
MEYIVTIEPESPFHIGEAGVGLEETSVVVHSDTLFSALCNMYALLYGGDELTDMLEKFTKEPPFLVSSTFLYAGDILTFPLPLGVDWSKFITDDLLEEFQKDRYELAKELGSTRFVSQGAFLSLLKGPSEELLKPPSHNILLLQNEDPPEEIFSVSETPRVAMDRKSKTSAIFHVGDVYYASGCGLYFFLRTDPEYDKRVRACINLLGHEGLGGKRTSGRGLFRPTFKKKSLRIPQSIMKITLSLTFPRPEELSVVKKGSYELVSRRGWIYTPRLKSLRKKGVRMLSEGSTFPQEVKGQLADVTPESIPGVPRIRQYGLGYYLSGGNDND